MSQTPRVGFLGPDGTFTHEAVRALGYDLASAVAYPSIYDVLDAVAHGELDSAVVPIENAIEGTVSATIDALVFDFDLVIQHEIVLPIHLHLLAAPGRTRADITSVASYTHALAQCRKYLAAGGWSDIRSLASTADAAQFVSQSDEPVAAIASDLAGELYGLVALESRIEDYDDNHTRFVVVGRDHIPAATGHDRTSIVCFQEADRPGSLYAILGRFAAREINLTKLESRPTKRGIGEYCFVMELEGHVADEAVADCLTDVQAHLTRVKFLGSYPVTGESADLRREEITVARTEAESWMQSVRRRIRS